MSMNPELQNQEPQTQPQQEPQQPATQPDVETNYDTEGIEDEALALLSHFAKEEQQQQLPVNDPEYQEYLQWKQQQQQLPVNDPEYQEYLQWKQQQQQQQLQPQQPQPQQPYLTPEMYERALKDPKEFGKVIETIQQQQQQAIMNSMVQMLEATEILFHLKEHEAKHPELSENPQVLQQALIKARMQGKNPKDIADRAVNLYLQAYKARNEILKSKGALRDVTNKEQLNINPNTRYQEQTQQQQSSPLDKILRAFKEVE